MFQVGKSRFSVAPVDLISGNRKWCRQTGSRQSTPLSTIRTRYGNSVSTPEATRTGKTQQNSLQKGSRYGISVSTPHRRCGHQLRTPFFQESAKGAGGKGARVINCHNFFFTPDRETRRIDHTTTEGTAERKMRQFATPAPFTPAPFRPF